MCIVIAGGRIIIIVRINYCYYWRGGEQSNS